MVNYEIKDHIQKSFLKNEEFRTCLQEHLAKLLSTRVCIDGNYSDENENEWASYWYIELIDIEDEQTKIKNQIYNAIKNIFEKRQAQTISDSKVIGRLDNPKIRSAKREYLQKKMIAYFRNVFTGLTRDTDFSLQVHYLAKDLCSSPSMTSIDSFIRGTFVEEIVLLPQEYERSNGVWQELESIITAANEAGSVIAHISKSATRQNKVILFGNSELVEPVKNKVLQHIKRYELVKFGLDWLKMHQVDYLLRVCSSKLNGIEEEYAEYRVRLMVRYREILAPSHLKDKIESQIKSLLSNSKSIIFESPLLSKDVAIVAEKYLKYIAHKSRCNASIELQARKKHHPVPKALQPKSTLLRTETKQSDLFLASSDVFCRVNIANGSIRIGTGDIALQEVDAIVVPITHDGLREGVIERAGIFTYEKTYGDDMSIKFTETDGGRLPCKRILLSNWILPSTTNKEELRHAVQMFISQSIKYASKDIEETQSIAFPIPHSCENESGLAHEIIRATKRQLESNQLKLRISFILLPKQTNLRGRFFDSLAKLQDTYASFNWSTAVLKIELISSDGEDLTSCKEKFNKYFQRSTATKTITYPDRVFNYWDQAMINAFYRYCQEHSVLPQINQTTNDIKLTGPINNVSQAEQKWYCLTALIPETLSLLPQTDYSNSGNKGSAVSKSKDTIGCLSGCTVMLSYCYEDNQKCQLLSNRLSECGCFVWAKPASDQHQQENFSQIRRSDCIILCISEDSYENASCEKETRHAFESGKKVVPVKIKNHQLIGWQRELLQGKLFFHLFGAEDHFDLEFGKVLIDILKHMKPDFSSAVLLTLTGQQATSAASGNLSVVEQRRIIHDNRINKLQELGRIKADEMKKLIEQMESMINETEEKDKESNINDQSQPEPSITAEQRDQIKRWLQKPTNVTKQNLPPFSITGDINDAVFPMPDYVLKYMQVYDESFSSQSADSVKSQYIFEKGIIKIPVEPPSRRVLYGPNPVNKEKIYGVSTAKVEYLSGVSQLFLGESSHRYQALHKKPRLPEVSLVVQSPIEEYQREATSEGTDTNQSRSYVYLTAEDKERCKANFAQKMRENAIEFEKFCSSF